MPYAFSLYLDILRFAAALCVLLSHANMREIVDRDLFPQSLGHDAVVIFFVLSGYVIAFVADTRESTRTGYWTSRLARVYSVALPGATNVLGVPTLAGLDVRPAQKTLLFDLGSLGIPLDNVEGMTLGPKLPDGRQSLVLVSDNNFAASQFTQFLLFALS